jgi:two-component system, LytTR family, response regulator
MHLLIENQQKIIAMKIITPKIPGLWLMDHTGAIRVDYDEILYCQHINDITKIFFLSGRHSSIQVSLKKLQEKLCRKKFYRCHRNYLVNLDYTRMSSLQCNDTLKVSVTKSIPVARRRKNELIRILNRELCPDISA